MSDWGQNGEDFVDQHELYPGQTCIECGDATVPGSGKFVNIGRTLGNPFATGGRVSVSDRMEDPN